MRELFITRLLQSLNGLLFALAAVKATTGVGCAMLLAAIPLAAVSWRRHGLLELRAALHSRGVWAAGLTAAVGTGAGAVAPTLADLGLVSLLMMLTPVFMVALAPLYHEKVVRGDMVALVVGLAGGAVMIAPQFGGPPGALIGIALALLVALVSALNGLQGRKVVLAGEDPWAASTAYLIIGAPPLIAFGWLCGTPPSFSAPSWMWLGLVAVNFAVTYVLWQIGLRTVRAMTSVLLRPMSAVIAAILGAVVLGQPITLWLIAGGGLMLASAQIAARAHAQAPPAPEPD